VLKPLLGATMLARQIERVRRCRRIDGLVVATSELPSDSAIARLCAQLRLPCFLGSLDDVLDRYYQSACQYRPDYVVRLTGDCPLADPQLIDAVIGFCLEGNYDYASNALQPTFPDGLDAEVMRFASLEQAWREARLPSEREHVTPFIYNHPQRFRIGSYTNAVDYSGLRWTVDEPEDFQLVERIYTALYPKDKEFGSADILALLEQHPEIVGNAGIVRNAGYLASLRKDQQTSRKN
jgi:spore coat polysaccharide biosynthesis protein SpsF